MIRGAGRIDDADGRPFIEWGMAGSPKGEERESGDACLVRSSADGVLIAAIDGAGHGAEAAAAAKVAETTLAAFAHESIISLVLRCHEELKQTRGAVMTLAFLHRLDRTLTWVGVGNVDAALFRVRGAQASPDRIVLRGGVVGYQLPALRAEVLPLMRSDLLVMASDGIEEHFADHMDLKGDPRELAEAVLAAHGKGTDDAIVVVARYLGTAES